MGSEREHKEIGRRWIMYMDRHDVHDGFDANADHPWRYLQ